MKGLEKKDNEDFSGTGFAILTKIAPGVPWNMQDMVDTVHHIRKRVIIQFVKRECRDTILKFPKNVKLGRKNTCFLEGLIQDDREARRPLWPQVKEARE